MKAEIGLIVGKRIAGVVVKKSAKGSPRSQVFLVFDDETTYELYAYTTICGAGGLDPEGIEYARRYGPGDAEIIFEKFEPSIDLSQTPSDERKSPISQEVIAALSTAREFDRWWATLSPEQKEEQRLNWPKAGKPN